MSVGGCYFMSQVLSREIHSVLMLDVICCASFSDYLLLKGLVCIAIAGNFRVISGQGCQNVLCACKVRMGFK